MEFSIVTVGLLIIAAISIVLGVRILLKGDWLLGFIRGSTGVIMLLGAVFLALAAINLSTYSQSSDNKVIANVSFTKLDVQSYEVEITDTESGDQHKITIDGDLWSISTRQLSVLISSKEFYEIDHIEGRFYALEQQKKSGNRRIYLPVNQLGIDLFQQFNKRYSPIIKAGYLNSAFIPLADRALFSVSLRGDSLSIRPMNAAAKAVVTQ